MTITLALASAYSFKPTTTLLTCDIAVILLLAIAYFAYLIGVNIAAQYGV